MMKILILGGTGAMGVPLTQILSGCGHSVDITTRSNRGSAEPLVRYLTIIIVLTSVNLKRSTTSSWSILPSMFLFPPPGCLTTARSRSTKRLRVCWIQQRISSSSPPTSMPFQRQNPKICCMLLKKELDDYQTLYNL